MIIMQWIDLLLIKAGSGNRTSVPVQAIIHFYSYFLQETALHFAAQNGQTNAVDDLLSMHAAIIIDNHNKTFLDIIIELKKRDVALAVVNHDR